MRTLAAETSGKLVGKLHKFVILICERTEAATGTPHFYPVQLLTCWTLMNVKEKNNLKLRIKHLSSYFFYLLSSIFELVGRFPLIKCIIHYSILPIALLLIQIRRLDCDLTREGVEKLPPPLSSDLSGPRVFFLTSVRTTV